MAGRAAVSEGSRPSSQLDPDRAGGITYGDIWGYTAPDGTEYAPPDRSARAGLQRHRRDGRPGRRRPSRSGSSPPAGAFDSKDVKVYGRHAYLVHERGPIQIIDLADPACPVEVGSSTCSPASNGGAHNVVVVDGHLWVTSAAARR